MRFVNHSFGDGPQVVSQISDLLRYDTRSTTVVGRHTRNYNSEVPAHVPWTVSCAGSTYVCTQVQVRSTAVLQVLCRYRYCDVYSAVPTRQVTE